MRARWFLPLTLLMFIGASLPLSEVEAQKKKKPVPAEAKKHFKTGIKAFKAKDFGLAVVSFKKAYELTKDGLVMGQVAKAYEKGGDYKAALASIKVYRKALPRRQRRSVNAMMKKYRRLIRKGKSKKLELPKLAAPAPKPDEPRPKPDELEPKPVEKTKPVEAKPVEAKPAETKPAETKPGPAVPPPPKDETKPVEGAGTESDTPAEGEDEEKKDKRFYTWIAAGSAAALALSGLVVGLNAQSKYDELNDTCSPGCSDDAVESVKTRALVADVLFGVAAAAAVTATVLYFLEGRGDKAAGEAATESAGTLNITPVVGGGTYGLSADIRF